MSTLNQILKKKRHPKVVKSNSQALKKCPQRKGVCLRVYITTPKKPNSAERKIAKIRLTTGIEVIAMIPGESHTLQEHSVVYFVGVEPKIYQE